MDSLTARPNLLKQANLTLIRNVIRHKGTATRAEIAAETNISSTTVRSLLNEMIENKEIESIGYDASSGGRKAKRYCFMPERYYCVAFCLTDTNVHALLINICGEILETTCLELKDNQYETVIFPFLDALMEKREIKAIGVGVPGVVAGGSYWKKRLSSEEFFEVAIGSSLESRYHVPVILENDINATTIGFGQCYAKEFPNINMEHTNMAYLHFEKGCISAGFIAGGRIIRGCNNYAGELGLIPLQDDTLLDARLASSTDELDYIRLVTRILCWICAILNPEYIGLNGPELNKDQVASIDSLLASLLPKQMTAQILYSSDSWHDYFNGIAYLTAGKMFEDIQFIKEKELEL